MFNRAAQALAIFRRGIVLYELAVALFILGSASLAYGLLNQNDFPNPASNATAITQPINTPTFLGYSPPISINIPSIKVSSGLIYTGLNADRTLAVPVGDNVDSAAWYKGSVSPGEVGTSIILGHVDTIKSGPSVFFNLGKLQPNQKIYVTRSDKKIAVFKVDSVRVFSKDNFPSKTVYKPAGYAALRVITCGGEWDVSTNHYTANTVVFASLAGIN